MEFKCSHHSTINRHSELCEALAGPWHSILSQIFQSLDGENYLNPQDAFLFLMFNCFNKANSVCVRLLHCNALTLLTLIGLDILS